MCINIIAIIIIIIIIIIVDRIIGFSEKWNIYFQNFVVRKIFTTLMIFQK